MELKKLKEILNSTYKESFYLQIKNQLILELKNCEIDQIVRNDIEFIMYIIDSPESLLVQDEDTRYQFLKSPNINHQIFTSINNQIEKINQLITKSIPPNFNMLLKELVNGYEESKQLLVQNAKENNSPNILKLPINLLREDLKFYDTPRHKIYETLSYSLDSLDFCKNNINGSSVITILNDICNKIDHGENLLRPLKEYAVYQFYCGLFGDDQKLISPTTLLLYCNVPFYDFDKCKKLSKLIKIKKKLNLDNYAQVYSFLPKEKERILNSFTLKYVKPVQANLFQKGKLFEDIINKPSNNNNNNDDSLLKLSQNNNFMYSFSSHILSSLLLNYSDSKSDNYIIGQDSKYIVGVDNDECLMNLDFQKLNGKLIIKFKNLLFTLNDLMALPIYNDVKEEFLNCNPYGFILEWLLKIYDQDIVLISQIQKSINSNINVKENRDTIIKNLLYELGLPHEFPKNWVNQMLERFIKIVSCLKLKNQIKHFDLFKEIYPLASFYYTSISKLPDPETRTLRLYTDDSYIEEYIANSPNKQQYQNIINNTNYELPTEKQSIKETIQSIVESLDVLKLTNEDFKCTFIPITKLLLSLAEKDIINSQLKFHSSWKSNLDVWVVELLNQSIEEDNIKNLIEDMFKLLNIQEFDLNNLERPLVYSIIKNVESNQLKDNVATVLDVLGLLKKCDLDKSYRGESPLDLAAFNRDKNLFIKLISLGAGKNSDPNTINNYYKTLSNKEKKELSSTIKKLNEINCKTNWPLSFDQLSHTLDIPNEIPLKSKLIIYNGTKIEERILTADINNKDLIIQGIHQIKVKFNPKFPGYHFAFNKLYQILFNDYQTPNSEIGILDSQPVLLTEYKNYTTLDEYLKDPNKKPINHSSLTKLIIMLLLFQKFEDNINNYVIDSNNRIHSIKNDDCFLPIKNNFNISKTRETNLKLFSIDQMEDIIDKEVSNNLLKLNLTKAIEQFIKQMKSTQYHMEELFLNKYYKKIEYDASNSHIGVLFYKGQFKKLYSRIKFIQKTLKSNKDIALIKLVDSVLGIPKSSYENLKEKSYKEIMVHYKLTNNTSTTIYANKSEEEYQKISKKHHIIDSIIKDMESTLETLNLQCKFNQLDGHQIKLYLKYIKSVESNKSYEHYAIDLLNKNQDAKLQYLSLKNFNILESYHLGLNCFASIKRINLSGCSNLKEFSPSKSFLYLRIEMSQLEKLSLNMCKNLLSINITAPNLKYFSASSCIKLNYLKLDSLNLEVIKLSNGTLGDINYSSSYRNKLSIFNDFLKFPSFKSLKELDISNNNIDYLEDLEMLEFLYKFELNGTKVIYDRKWNLYRINAYEFINNDINQKNKIEEDLNIKILLGIETTNGNRKLPINKFHKYLSDYVNVKYDLLYINHNNINNDNINSDKSIILLVINPHKFNYESVKSKYNQLQKEKCKVYVYGVSKLSSNRNHSDGAELENQEKNIRLLRSDESIRKNLWLRFNINLSDEKGLRNELFNNIFNDQNFK